MKGGTATGSEAATEVTADVTGRKVTYLLAERMVRVAKGFRMREVRRLCENGHQTSVVDQA